MKIIVTTSDAYKHIVPIFCFLFNKYWSSNQEVEIVSYAPPIYPLPSNFKLVSLGEQSGNVKDFSNDLRKYFEQCDNHFIWMMEDSFLRDYVDFKKLKILQSLIETPNVGRINLSKECVKQDHGLYNVVQGYQVYANTQTANYRLSTQPSIWKKEFLLKYLTSNLSPWEFETQYSINDGWTILGLGEAVVPHNEGVNKRDLYNYNFDRIPEEVIIEMKQLNII